MAFWIVLGGLLFLAGVYLLWQGLIEKWEETAE